MWLIFNLVCNNILQEMCSKLHFIIEDECLMHMCTCVCIYTNVYCLSFHLFEHLSSLCCTYISLLLRISMCM